MHLQRAAHHRKPAPPAAPASAGSSPASSPPELKPRNAASPAFPPQPAPKLSEAPDVSRPQWRAPSGQSPAALERLLAAIGNDNWQKVEKALSDHPEFPVSTDDLMRYAVQADAGKVAFRLQSNGVDPFGPDVQASAFHAALSTRKYGIAQEMLKYAQRMNDDALPDLGPYLKFALDNNEVQAVSWLLRFSLEQRLDVPFDVLREAIDTSNMRCIELLTGHPRLADAFAEHKVERSILHYAIRNGSADTVGFLLSRKPGHERAAGLCARNKSTGSTALHVAVASGDPAKLTLILDTHARERLGKDALDAKDATGRSPLALALEGGQFDMADRLLDSGAQPLAAAH
jgi:ankyrin repeat protein